MGITSLMCVVGLCIWTIADMAMEKLFENFLNGVSPNGYW
jgi:hypothetical protein